jgi:hypothetical protein
MSEVRTTSIPIEVPISEVELHESLTSMAAMGVPSLEGHELDTYREMGYLGFTFYNILHEHDCIRDGAFRWRAQGWDTFRRSRSVEGEIKSAGEFISGSEATQTVPIRISYNVAGIYDIFSSKYGYMLEAAGVSRDEDIQEKYSVLFRMGAMAIHDIVDSVQFNGARADRPIELSWGNNNTVYGGQRSYRYRGVQLSKGRLENTPRGLKKFLAR